MSNPMKAPPLESIRPTGRHEENEMNAKTIAGRPYVMGSGVLDTTGRQRILVIDVAEGKAVSEHQSSALATLEMIRYAKANQIKTKLAIASDFGDGRPLVITETY